MKITISGIIKLLKSKGYHITDTNKVINETAPELNDQELEIILDVHKNSYSMSSISRMINVVKSCKYCVENNIPGDFVECGVWRGGNEIIARKIFDLMNSDKEVYMYDTFAGMTKPTNFDIKLVSKRPAIDKFNTEQRDTFNNWCYASLDEVKNNCKKSNLNLDKIKFIKGDVSKTLIDKSNLPDKICVLRLDTDWYESTKVELDILYPILSQKGVLILDDYGHWEGAKKAVDEYFSSAIYKPLFNVIDSTARSSIKL